MGWKYSTIEEYRIANNRQRRERYWQNSEYREILKAKARSRTKPYTLDISDSRRVARAGIDLDTLQNLLNSQNYSCAICGDSEGLVLLKTKKRLAIDYNHKTGEIRGMLCGPCNRALGLLKDSPVILQAAINYLVKAKESINV